MASTIKSNIQCYRLGGKVAVVTGSHEGIGFAIAERLAREGAKIVLCALNQEDLDLAIKKLSAKGHEVTGLIGDLTMFENRKNLLDKIASKYGRLDCLVANAAVVAYVGPLLECPESIWDTIFDANLKSTFMLMKESLPLLKKGQASSIIIISSIVGHTYMPFMGPYAISKTALFGMCKYAATELAEHGIRVNCIAPGAIDTPNSQKLFENKKLLEKTLEIIPMKRTGFSEEIGAVAAFLASSDASYITGETICVGGGLTGRL